MSYKPNIDELERYNEEVQEAMIFENRHTVYTMEVRDTALLSTCTVCTKVQKVMQKCYTNNSNNNHSNNNNNE